MQDMQEMWVRSLGVEDPLEAKMATRSSILSWKILGTEEPGRLQSIVSQKSLSRALEHRACARTKSSMLLASPFFLHVLFLPFSGIVIMKKFSNIHRSIEVSQ